MYWSKPSENRFCGRSAKTIGLSEALVERQLAWASRGRRWHTRWISWGSLGLPSEAVPNLRLLGRLGSPREKAPDPYHSALPGLPDKIGPTCSATSNTEMAESMLEPVPDSA